MAAGGFFDRRCPLLLLLLVPGGGVSATRERAGGTLLLASEPDRNPDAGEPASDCTPSSVAEDALMVQGSEAMLC